MPQNYDTKFIINAERRLNVKIWPVNLSIKIKMSLIEVFEK